MGYSTALEPALCSLTCILRMVTALVGRTMGFEPIHIPSQGMGLTIIVYSPCKPPVRFELTTPDLQKRCSATELKRQGCLGTFDYRDDSEALKDYEPALGSDNTRGIPSERSRMLIGRGNPTRMTRFELAFSSVTGKRPNH